VLLVAYSELMEFNSCCKFTVVYLSDAEPLSVSQFYRDHGRTLTQLQLAAGRSPVTPIPCSSGTQVAGQDIAAAHLADAEFL